MVFNYMTLLFKKLLTIIACGIVFQTNAKAATIANGDFEVTDVTFEYFSTGPGPSPWMVDTAMYLIDCISYNGGLNDVASSGTQYMAYAGNGSGISQLSQYVNGLAVGQEYIVSYYVSALAFRTFSQNIYGAFGVSGSIGGVSDAYNSSLPDPGDNNTIDAGTTQSPWIRRSFQFTATSSADTLKFIFTGGNGGSISGSYPAIDDVKISIVPEPSAILISVMGIVALSSFIRTRSPQS